ncbi:MAG: hypothetical protein M3Y72_07535 [Acidobacteriota bacterium]|nr:hypothetical protein [Acidobacteriota bacterium]
MSYLKSISLLTLLAATAASADTISAIVSRSALGATDSLDWGAVGPAFSLHSSPLLANTANGLSVVGSLPSDQGPFQILVQCSSPGAGPDCVGGNFSPRDNILFTNFFQDGPLTLSFSSPVRGAGFQIEDEGVLPGTPFVTSVQAFNGSTLLGTVNENGLTNSTADGTAIFFGALSDSVNINSLVFTTKNNAGELGALLVDRLYVNPSPAGTSTPEPSSFMLVAMILMFGAVGFHLKKGIFRKALSS